MHAIKNDIMFHYEVITVYTIVINKMLYTLETNHDL